MRAENNILLDIRKDRHALTIKNIYNSYKQHVAEWLAPPISDHGLAGSIPAKGAIRSEQ